MVWTPSFWYLELINGNTFWYETENTETTNSQFFLKEVKPNANKTQHLVNSSSVFPHSAAGFVELQQSRHSKGLAGKNKCVSSPSSPLDCVSSSVWRVVPVSALLILLRVTTSITSIFGSTLLIESHIDLRTLWRTRPTEIKQCPA